MPKKQKQGGKKGRKIGRMKNKPAYKRYLAENRRNKNKAKKLARYMKKFPNWKPNNLSEELERAVNKYFD